MITKLIDNFTGQLTRDNIGDMNSGLAKYATTFGNDPFSNPGNLTWLETPVSILQTGLGAGPIVAMRPRIEGDTVFVYAVTTQAKLYKIQVNNTSTKNPDYDIASLITTLTQQSPTLLLGSSIQYYGVTEKLFIGTDAGVTKINFDGTGETFVGSLGSYTANVPRPSASFLGKLYFGNGSNLVEIDSTETVTSYAKLSPGFPAGTYVRDLDVSPDGNYLQITVSRLNAQRQDGQVINSTSLGSVDSYKFLWNGFDTGYTSYESYNGYSLTSNTVFGSSNYTTGFDVGGTALYSGATKLITLTDAISPNFASMFSSGNLVGFAVPEYDTSSNTFKGSIFFYGQYDREVPKGLFRFLKQTATQGSDVIVMPAATTVSNLSYVPPFYGYVNNIGGSSKIYFSTGEIVNSGGLQVFYNLYRFTLTPTGAGTAIGGVYETQNETSIKLFRNILKKRLKVYEVRVYGQEWVTNNSFKIDIIDNDGNPTANSSYTFATSDGTLTIGTDYCKYNPKMEPQQSIGIRITNLGSINFVVNKIEIDVDEINA